VQPFDQPDVAAAKAATNEVLRGGDVTVPVQPLAAMLDAVRPGDHLALQVFADPGTHDADVLDAVRTALRDRLGVAVSLGFGPRFLHSTGQLHKGGPPTGRFLQIVHDGESDIEVPEAGYTFGTLKNAQATGDLQTLRAHGLPAERVRLEGDPVEGLRQLTERIRGLL
jgi:transaldolase / glucose-6-phosphate isomerase